MPHSPTPPASKTPSGAFLPPVLPIVLDQPLQWLALGFKDFSKSPWLSTLHGLILAVWGVLITWLAHDRFWLLAGSLSGFLVIAPVLATSLYAMSRAMERGEKVDFQLLVHTWSQWQLRLRHQPDSYWSLIRFGLLLALAATGWVITSSALITLLAPAPIHTGHPRGQVEVLEQAPFPVRTLVGFRRLDGSTRFCLECDFHAFVA